MTSSVVKIDLSGKYKIKEVGSPTLFGHIGADSSLQQMDAFLGSLRAALTDHPDKLESDLAKAIRYASDKANSAGFLLSLIVESSLNPQTKSIAYSFTLKTSDHG